MLIKLLTEARKGRENSSAKRDSLLWPEDGYLQLVIIVIIVTIIGFVSITPLQCQTSEDVIDNNRLTITITIKFNNNRFDSDGSTIPAICELDF